MKILDLFIDSSLKKFRVSYPYIIAEAGVNHGGDIELAKRLIDEAAEAGAHAIKFQSYKAATLASRNSPSYWDTTKEKTESQYELFCKYDSFWKDEFEDLKTHCDKCEIEFLSTPFDIESANFLNDLMPVYKISSSDITNKPFIQHICRFDKPIVLSTGASYLYEIQEAVEWVGQFGNSLALLHCVLNYPTMNVNANLGMITGLKKEFPDKIIGYSDHTLPGSMESLQTAFLLGAVILEKHFTHDKTLPGNDHYHAMDKYDLEKLNHRLTELHELIGGYDVTALSSETPARDNARRSLVAQVDIHEGKVISENDLTYKRPASGISPKFIDDVIGRRARRYIPEDTVLKWALFDE